MACSRTPKCRLRPHSLTSVHAFVARSAGAKDGSSAMAVLLEPARSALPPHNSGSTPAKALMTLPEAARVAIALPGSNCGSADSTSAGSSPSCRRFSNAACCGWACCQAAKRGSHSARNARARLATFSLVAATISAGTSNILVGSSPSAVLRPSSSEVPRAEP